MSTDAARAPDGQLWKPHPDDEAEVAEAMRAADRGEYLSDAACEAFLRWLEGSGEETWRDELG